eukprot:765544_1
MSLIIALSFLLFSIYGKQFNADAEVQLNVYFESCCSDCQNFITGAFKHAFYTPGWTNMTNITALPTGKCNETYNSNTKQYIFSCQHGSTECKGNIWMACGMSTLYGMDPVKYGPFIINFMQAVINAENNDIHQCPGVNMDNIAKSVCNSLDSCDWNTLSQCTRSNNGNQIYHSMVAVTPYPNAINWVPWIVLNGQHSQQEQSSCESNVLNCTC